MKTIYGLFCVLVFLGSCAGTDKDSTSSKSGEDHTSNPETTESVTVYSHRHYDIDKEIFSAFEKETGIQVLVKEDKASKLIELISQKKDAADILITVDVARLDQAKNKNILQPIQSDYINSRVPSNFMDSDYMWFGLTKRYRVLAYSKERVNPVDIKNYTDLAQPKWKGKIAVRSSGNTYNQSLMASVIANSDQTKAETWAKSLVANFSRSPKGNDRDQVKEVAADRADIAIINTYYLGKLLNSENEQEVEAGKSVGLIFPNQENSGAHVNISGIGVCKYAPNKDNAIQLIEYLLSDKVQELYSAANYEYPIVKDIPICDLLQSWGSFREDTIDLEEIGQLNTAALEVFARAGWE